jgi:hypothetical protein
LSSIEPAERTPITSEAKRVWRADFVGTADTASAARRWLRSCLGEHVGRDQLDTATLLTEETVASSARWAAAEEPITVQLSLQGGFLRVEVLHAGDGGRSSAVETGGPIGGLTMVGRNARSWGITPGPPTRVWFEI